jgi:hypothetical protein
LVPALKKEDSAVPETNHLVSLRKRKKEKEKLEHGCCIRWRECEPREPFPQSSNNTNNKQLHFCFNNSPT